MTKQELKKWYKSVDFIKKEMQFYSIKDFWKNSSNINYFFKNGNSYDRQLYQWYVFANPNISQAQKEMVWNYITGYYKEED